MHKSCTHSISGGAPRFKINKVEESGQQDIATRIEGTMEVPLFLNQRLPGLGAARWT